MSRGLSQEFLNAMREGLEKGRRNGYRGWDQYWEKVTFPCAPIVYMMIRLHAEVDELVVALHKDDSKLILREAADIANFAMFIADMYKDSENPPAKGRESKGD